MTDSNSLFPPIRLAILVSGSGSNAEKIHRYFQEINGFEVVFWACNRLGAGAFERAANVGTTIDHLADLENPVGVFAQKLRAERIDGLILAGFLKLIPIWLVDAFPDRIINIHPSLLPKHGGKGMYGMNVHRAVIDAHETESGITIHLVNHAFDEGPIIQQFHCPVLEKDTPEELAKRVQKLEHQHFAPTIHRYFLDPANRKSHNL